MQQNLQFNAQIAASVSSETRSPPQDMLDLPEELRRDDLVTRRPFSLKDIFICFRVYTLCPFLVRSVKSLNGAHVQTHYSQTRKLGKYSDNYIYNTHISLTVKNHAIQSAPTTSLSKLSPSGWSETGPHDGCQCLIFTEN